MWLLLAGHTWMAFHNISNIQIVEITVWSRKRPYHSREKMTFLRPDQAFSRRIIMSANILASMAADSFMMLYLNYSQRGRLLYSMNNRRQENALLQTYSTVLDRLTLADELHATVIITVVTVADTHETRLPMKRRETRS